MHSPIPRLVPPPKEGSSERAPLFQHCIQTELLLEVQLDAPVLLTTFLSAVVVLERLAPALCGQFVQCNALLRQIGLDGFGAAQGEPQVVGIGSHAVRPSHHGHAILSMVGFDDCQGLVQSGLAFRTERRLVKIEVHVMKFDDRHLGAVLVEGLFRDAGATTASGIPADLLRDKGPLLMLIWVVTGYMSGEWLSLNAGMTGFILITFFISTYRIIRMMNGNLEAFDLVGEKVMEIAEDARADLAAQAREEQACREDEGS